jgi:general secretion pathway protein F
VSLTTDGTGPTGGAISLDHLIALNDEIAALVRAGVPLERGLTEVGEDLRGTLGTVTTTLGNRMARGESLAQAVEAEGSAFPRVYRAVIEAGLRSGRLAVALEGLAAYARGYADLRRALGMALVYPVVVLVLGYGLFVGFVWLVAPKFLAAFADFRLPIRGPIAWFAYLGGTLPYWVAVGPVVLLLFWTWWAWSGRSASLQGGWGGPIGWLPGTRRMAADTRAANFADLLALLVEHQVPLQDAVTLAAEATGDASLRRAAGTIADAIRRGEPPGDGAGGALPPLLGWLMATGARQGGLAAALRQAAGLYRRRALQRADLLRAMLPTVMLFAIGATATLFYTLSLFIPLTELLGNLALDR